MGIITGSTATKVVQPSSADIQIQVKKISEALARMNAANEKFIGEKDPDLTMAYKTSAMSATEEYLAQLRISSGKLGRGRSRRHR